MVVDSMMKNNQFNDLLAMRATHPTFKEDVDNNVEFAFQQFWHMLNYKDKNDDIETIFDLDCEYDHEATIAYEQRVKTMFRILNDNYQSNMFKKHLLSQAKAVVKFIVLDSALIDQHSTACADILQYLLIDNKNTAPEYLTSCALYWVISREKWELMYQLFDNYTFDHTNDRHTIQTFLMTIDTAWLRRDKEARNAFVYLATRYKEQAVEQIQNHWDQSYLNKLVPVC